MRSVLVGIIFSLLVVPTARAAVYDLRATPLANKITTAITKSLGGAGGDIKIQITRLVLDTGVHEVQGDVTVSLQHSFGSVSWTDYFSYPPVNNQQDLSVSASGTGSFLFNYLSGTGGIGISIPIGEKSISFLGAKYSWDFGDLKISVGTIKEIMDGNLIAALQGIPALGVARKEFRDAYADKVRELTRTYGVDNFYLASKAGFVNTVRPSEAFNDAISLILTAGASSPLIMNKLRTVALGEVTGIEDWLKHRGVTRFASVAQDLLKGNTARFWDYYIAVKWTTINYESRTLILDVPTPWISETHGAFYLVLRRNGDGDTPPPPGSAGPANGSHDPRPIGIPHNTVGRFKVTIRNQTGLPLRIKGVSFSSTSPVFQTDIVPGRFEVVNFDGKGERVFAAWSVGEGRLLVYRSVPVTSDVVITIKPPRAGAPFILEY